MINPGHQVIRDLVGGLRSGVISLDDYLSVLEAVVTTREPEIQALLPEGNRFERLRREAREMFVRYPEPGGRPPLFGLPVGVKDIFQVRGFVTRAGSSLPIEVLQGSEAVAVSELRKNGALILGKTVTTEFAYLAPGPTRNPRNPKHTPGGSSSGSAAAVSAGYCPLALGTQTVGSIIRPAAFCGVVGYKPTYGRISSDGVIPLAPSVDHVGLFTGDVPGAGLVASFLCLDWRHVQLPRLPVLGLPQGPYLEQVVGESAQQFARVCEGLINAGYNILPVPTMPDFVALASFHLDLVAAEASRVHQHWFDQYADRYKAQTVSLIERGRTVDAGALYAALESRILLRQRLAALMDDYGVDLWLAPSALGPAPEGLQSTGDPIMNLPWTHCGFPVINLPCGFSDLGLPFGLQLIAGWGSDEELLAWAARLAPLVRQIN